MSWSNTVGVRLVTVVVAFAVMVVASGAGTIGTVQAAATPQPAQDDWTVEAVSIAGGPAWRITWSPPGGVTVRSERGVITSDGRPVGTALEAPDLRSVSVVTTDPRLVLGRPRFALTYGGVEVGTAPGDRLVPPPAASDPAASFKPPRLRADPGAPGPFAVRRDSYDLGAQALTLRALEEPVELAGEVTWPRGVAGPRPVVVFLHGRHATCFRGDQATLAWPCPDRMRPIRSHAGYRDAARVLASHGYVVISVSANGVNAVDGGLLDGGALARAQLVLAHLDQWRRWSTAGGEPFGRTFVGRLDLSNVGLMGHSRGGEGVVRAALLNAGNRRPYGIRGVMPLAPTNFQRLTLPGVAMSVVLPYCDGDVSDLQGQRYYDDARYALKGDPAPRSVVTVMGANHNFFNSEWTPGVAAAPADDDWGGSSGRNRVCDAGRRSRLTAAEQRAVGTAYVAGFFRLHLGGEQRLLGLLDGSGARAASAGRAVVRVVAQSPRRRVLARFGSPSPEVRTRGVQAVDCAGAELAHRTGGRSPSCANGVDQAQVPQWGVSHITPLTPTLAALSVRWNRPGGAVDVTVPRKRQDLSSMTALTFRAASDPRVGPADLRVTVTDRSGKRASVLASEVSSGLSSPPGDAAPLPHVLLQQVHVPLSRFSSVDLRRVASVSLRPASPVGHVWLADLAAQRGAVGRTNLETLPSLEIDNVRMREGDAGPRSARFTITASRASDVPMSVFVQATRTFPESEFQEFEPYRTGRRVTLPPGTRSATVDVPLRPNERYDDDLHFIVSMSATRNAIIRRLAGNGLVRDDDPMPTLTIEEAVANESEPFLEFTMRLSAPSGKFVGALAMAESDTAIAGEDFEDVGVVDGGIEPGGTKGSFRVPLLDDDVPEPTEHLDLRMLIAAGLLPGDGVRAQVVGAVYEGPERLRGTIIDDD